MRRWIAASAALGGGVALAVALFWPAYIVFEVVPTETARAALCAKMRPGEEVVLSFTHSVNRRPVYDTLRPAGDHIVIVKSRFDAFGGRHAGTLHARGGLPRRGGRLVGMDGQPPHGRGWSSVSGESRTTRFR